MAAAFAPAAHAIRAFGARAAAVDASVLLTGESGTGKGILAHGASVEASCVFVAPRWCVSPYSG